MWACIFVRVASSGVYESSELSFWLSLVKVGDMLIGGYGVSHGHYTYYFRYAPCSRAYILEFCFACGLWG
ncbi:MAG: hypothetical protein NZM25_05055 [Leptospiraceae bacterium]|nr:hypothetical protein [Leptospiraceae bacterium]MDW8305623.1 hypothetical protein [Leptospiraceae bacterium]